MRSSISGLGSRSGSGSNNNNNPPFSNVTKLLLLLSPRRRQRKALFLILPPFVIWSTVRFGPNPTTHFSTSSKSSSMAPTYYSKSTPSSSTISTSSSTSPSSTSSTTSSWSATILTKLRSYVPSFLRNPQNSAVICAIVIQEENYLDEWIDYHLGIGFLHIYIYDNSEEFDLGRRVDNVNNNVNNVKSGSGNGNGIGSGNGSDSLSWLERRPRLRDKVTLFHFPGKAMQFAAYQDCGKRVLKEKRHRWVAYFDADEFLELRRRHHGKHDHDKHLENDHDNHLDNDHDGIHNYNEYDVVDFLLQYCPGGVLSLNWLMHPWNHRMQYSPKPVSLRFRGVDEADGGKYHVKSIANVADIRLDVVDSPHFMHVKRGFGQVDTNGEEIVGEKWWNEKYPIDVAVLHHYHTKSWKEFIAKRSRGRSDGDFGDDAVREALAGEGLRNATMDGSNGSVWDVWDVLKQVRPKYRFFDSLNAPSSNAVDLPYIVGSHATATSASVSKNSSSTASPAESTAALTASLTGSSSTMFTKTAICCLVADQEAYIDEWVDYHLALGFTIYIYDGSEFFWMGQWGREKSERIERQQMLKRQQMRQESQTREERQRRREMLGKSEHEEDESFSKAFPNVVVTHFPGDGKDVDSDFDHESMLKLKAKAYANCTALHGSKHHSLAFMEINDFFMFPNQRDRKGQSNLNTRNDRIAADDLMSSLSSHSPPSSHSSHSSSSQSSCAHLIPRVVFGHGGQYVYDPLPVTKRFMFRVHPSELDEESSGLLPSSPSSSISDVLNPILVISTKWIEEAEETKEKNEKKNAILNHLEKYMEEFLRLGQWKADGCPLNPSSDDTHGVTNSVMNIKMENDTETTAAIATTTAIKVTVYHYLLSVKECVKQRRHVQLCNLRGMVKDEFGWESVQNYLPIYSGFNGML